MWPTECSERCSGTYVQADPRGLAFTRWPARQAAPLRAGAVLHPLPLRVACTARVQHNACRRGRRTGRTPPDRRGRARGADAQRRAVQLARKRSNQHSACRSSCDFGRAMRLSRSALARESAIRSNRMGSDPDRRARRGPRRRCGLLHRWARPAHCTVGLGRS